MCVTDPAQYCMYIKGNHLIMTSASIYTDEAPDEHRGCTDETRCHTRYSRNASVQPDFRLIEAFRCAVGRSGAVLLAGRRRTQAI